MISFGLRNFHPIYTPNCQGPRFDRARRRVNTLSIHKLIVFFHRWLYRLAVSISIFASALGASIGASYSTFCNNFLFIIMIILHFQRLFSDGRKPVYVYTLPLLFLGSFGVANSRTIPQLLSWRFLQSFGASPTVSVGGGVIGDIYKLEERGQAMGIFISVRHFILHCHRKWI